MATLYVRTGGSGGGSAVEPFGTLNAAAAVARPGDVVIIGDGIYDLKAGQGIDRAPRKVALDTPNVTWRAETPGGAIFRGDWSPALLRDGQMPDAKGHYGGGMYSAIITLDAPGVVLDGVVVERVSCEGIGVHGEHAGMAVLNCSTYFTGGAGINAKTGGRVDGPAKWAKGLRIEGNTIILASTLSLDPVWRNSTSGRPDPAIVAMPVGNVIDPVIRNNRVGYCFGEGIALAKNVRGAVVSGNVVNDTRHVELYVLHSEDSDLFENICYATSGHAVYRKPPGNSGNAFAVRDERSDDMGPSDNIRVYSNLFVGTDGGINIASRYGKEPGYIYLGHNTVAGGSDKALVNLANGRGVFENNVVERASAPGPVAVADASGFKVRNNVWSHEPPPALRTGAKVGPVGLVKADRQLVTVGMERDFPPTYAEFLARVSDNFTLADYRPTAGSAVLGAAVASDATPEALRGRTYAGALSTGPGGPPPPDDDPPPPDDDPPPDPPDGPEPPLRTPDWDALIEQAAAVGVQLAVQAEANRNRWALLEELRKAEAVFSLALDQATAELGELLLKLDEYKQAAEGGEE